MMNDEFVLSNSRQTLAQVSRCPGHVVCHCFWFVLNQLHTLNNNSQATMGNNNNSGVVLTVYTIAVIKNV